jgi:hypothetical protein
MKKKVPFTVKDEDANDSVLHWKQKHSEAVDKWIRLDSLLTKVIRENDALKAELNQLKGAEGEEPKRHPGYIMGDHWLQAAYTRVCTGEDIQNVMAEYGWYP